MNWNIQSLGPTKMGVGGMPRALGEVIAANADVAIITEVSAGHAAETMSLLTQLARSAADGAGNWAWNISYPTGGECYGVIFRDLNVTRPVLVTSGPIGDTEDPLVNLDQNRFQTWPVPFPPPAPPPPDPPPLPLVDVFSSSPPAGRKRRRFAGQTLATGGYALGKGFRMPCLVMVCVYSAVAQYLLPILVCHLGAVRGGLNTLARGQISQYKETDIAQRFTTGGYIDLDEQAVPVQELIVTGDFNVDFLQNRAVGTALQTGNRAALNHLTPTQAGGSSFPRARPPCPVPHPRLPCPSKSPRRDGRQARSPPPSRTWRCAPLPPTGGRCSSGPRSRRWPTCRRTPRLASTTSSTEARSLPGRTAARAWCEPDLVEPGESCVIPSLPDMVTRVDLAGRPNVGRFWHEYRWLPLRLVGTPPLKRQWAIWAPNLSPFAVPAMGPEDRLVGARFLSDHLPTVIQVNLP